MRVAYTHLLAASTAVALMTAAGYQLASLPVRVNTVLQQLVDSINNTPLPNNLHLHASQQQYQRDLFASSGQLNIDLKANGGSVQYALQYQVAHGISALLSGATVTARLFSLDSTMRDKSHWSGFLFQREPIRLSGIIKPDRVEVTGIIPAFKSEVPGRLIHSKPASLTFSARQPGTQNHWSQTQFRLQLPEVQLWEDSSHAEGITLTNLRIDTVQNKAGNTLSATMDSRLSQLEIRSPAQLIQLSDLQLTSHTQLQNSLKILWTLNFDRFNSRQLQLQNGHMRLALNGINGDAVRQLIDVSQQARHYNWSAEHIRREHAEQLRHLGNQLLSRNPRLTLQAMHVTVPTSGNRVAGDASFNAEIQLDHTRLPENFISQLPDNNQALAQLSTALLATLNINSHGIATELVQALLHPAGQPFKQALADGNLSFQLKNGIATLDNSPLQ